MNLCFSTLGCTERSLGDILKTASAYGIGGLEIRGIGGQMQNGAIPDFKEDRATKTKSEFQKHGVTPAVLGTSCMFHTAQLADAALREGEESIRIAARMGIPYIRVFGNSITGDTDACYARVSAGIGQLCRIAAPQNVSVLLEVHGDFNTEARLSPLLDRLGGFENFGLIWDVAHSHRAVGRDFLPFYRFIRPFIRHVHIKDVRDADGALTLPGQGDIPLTEILAVMQSDGYTGLFSLEWERRWVPSLAPIEEALAQFIAVCRRADAL